MDNMEKELEDGRKKEIKKQTNKNKFDTYLKNNSDKNLKLNDKEHNNELFNNYKKEWKSLRQGKMVIQERILNDVFSNKNKSDIDIVLKKVSLLNDFYSTNIFDTYTVAKNIIKNHTKIDKAIEEGNIKYIDEIAKQLLFKDDGNPILILSFISKYFSFHNPDAFPIYDSRNKYVLSYYKREICKYNKNLEFTINSSKKNPKNSISDSYVKYCEVLDCYKKTFGFENKSAKEIDKFNWCYFTAIVEGNNQ